MYYGLFSHPKFFLRWHLSSWRKWPSHTHKLCMVDCQAWTAQICATCDFDKSCSWS